MRSVRRNNPNLFVGLILVVLLAVFIAPSSLPRFLSNVFPQFAAGVPCSWLKTAEDRANHQSLLGRAAANPISLRVQPSPLPDPSNASGSWYVSIIVTNNSLGTVPFVYDPQSVIVGDSGTSGLGLIFNPANSLTAGAPRQDSGTIPEQDLRLLGPRQSCVVTVEFAAGDARINLDPTTRSSTVRAFYRNNQRGQITQLADTLATPIYTDQGLWTGYMESAPAPVS